ncbi:hypothetical protein VNO77_18536 [Canavalia gladiata]|uniref:Uncharacterized protein n=1 Tax=Canavalia gladiata TaxID=3824 RepID=A0AAN9LPH6_CANGL
MLGSPSQSEGPSRVRFRPLSFGVVLSFVSINEFQFGTSNLKNPKYHKHKLQPNFHFQVGSQPLLNFVFLSHSHRQI